MRAIMSTVLGYCYTCGQFILPGLAYAIPQWRWLQLTVSIPFLAFFLLSWYVVFSSSSSSLLPPGPNRGNLCLTRLAELSPRTPLSQSREGHSREEELIHKGVLQEQVSGGHSVEEGAKLRCRARGQAVESTESQGASASGEGQRMPLNVSAVWKDLTKLLFVTQGRTQVGGDEREKGHDCVGRRSLGDKSERHFEGQIHRVWGLLDLRYKGKESPNLATWENRRVWVRDPK